MNAWHVPVFGVRHLSPAGAWHLRRYLDKLRPKLVLVEGLADATPLVRDITRSDTVPPIAILAYTEAPPVRTLVYPLARYSPEYQALVWAKENRVDVDLIDLPSDIFLALEDRELARSHGDESDEPPSATADVAQDEPSVEAASPPSESPPESAALQALLVASRPSVYEQLARRTGEPDYETYWERRFEHNCCDGSYRLAALQFGAALRELAEDWPRSMAEDLVREAYMRRRIEAAIADGVKPEQIVAVVGAFHAPVLNGTLPAMTDEELASLARRASKLTLMPYSYFKLSTQSGYGAGNHAPFYFERLWDALEEAQIEDHPARYLTRVARAMRARGSARSTADIIEAVRLAKTLSALKDGSAPTLRDLHDAATTLLGHGQRSVVQDALARVDVGTAIGSLPKGVSRTSIQDDFERKLGELKLEKFKTTVSQELSLDLRENRRVKSEAAAFLDLHRSSFLHRLRVLDVGFAEPVATNQEGANWAEKWLVRWGPESEIALVEAVLLGETIELAVSFKFKTSLESCVSIADAAAMVRDACQCGLMSSMILARSRLQELAAETTAFVEVARAAYQLGQTVRYGDVRQFDPGPLLPLIEELFVQGALALDGAANCDNEAATQGATAIDELNQVGLEYHDRVEEALWIDRLQRLADADDRNPLLSGYACGILLERGLVPNEALAREVSRRLSPGIPADLGAGWFEGLSMRNRYTLLARQPLWQQLAQYVASLDEDQFRRALVFLRRAFGGFNAHEKRHIAENLGEHWNVHAEAASELIEQPLTEAEEERLAELNDFDFGDL